MVSACSNPVGPSAISTDGPTVRQNPTTYYPRFPVGTTFTDGLQKFVISGTRPATIEDVQAIGTTSGMKFLGASVAGEDRRWAAIESMPSYPPTQSSLGSIRPAAGAVVRPGRVGAELLLGMKITKPGIQQRPGIRVIYSIAGQKYQVDYHATIVNCPRGFSYKECEVPMPSGQ